MPHYLVRGASSLDAADRAFAVFAADESGARAAASQVGIFVSSVVPLDQGEPVPHDAGRSSALARLATKLSRESRTDDAIAVMEQVYAMRVGESVSSLCLRIPRYLLKAGRRDEAWRYLQRMRVSEIAGNSLGCDRSPADFTAFYKMCARVVRAGGRKDHAAIYEAAAEIAFVVNEYASACDGCSDRAVANRREAVESIADVAASVLPTVQSAKAWAELFVGRSERLAYAAAIRLASDAYPSLLRAVQSVQVRSPA